MQIIHHLTIDMAKRLYVSPVYAVQDDGSTRAVEIALLENGSPWEVPEGITAAVAFRKPDKTKGLYDRLPDGTAAVTIVGSTVTAILAPQVLSCAGDTYAAVVFHDADLNQLATFPFTLRVAANPAAGQTVSSDYYRYATMEAVSQAVDAFLTKAEEALAVVHDTATEDAPAIVCEASGSVVTVSDAAERPLQGLTLYGRTTQDGLPTPETPVELVSVGESGAICVTVAGKNLIDSSGISSTSVSAYYYPVKVNAGNYKLTMFNPDGTTDGLPVNAQYSASFLDADGNVIAGNVQKGVTVSAEEASKITQLKVNLDGAQYTGSHDTICGQLESGLAATAYEPCKSQTLTTSVEDGLDGIGEVKDEIEFARGVRVQRVYTKVFDGTEALTKVGTKQFAWNHANGTVTHASVADALCSHLSYDFYAWGNAVTGFVKHNAYINMRVMELTEDSTAAFAAYLAQQYANGTPFTVKYVLAEPIETALTAEELAAFAALHSNKPNTTVFNDSGAEMKLSYVADTKTYIDRKLAAISAAMLG